MDTDAILTRIEVVSKSAKSTWYVLLVYLAFIGVTLLDVEDVDFFVPTEQTELPLIGTSIPTASFFWIAPILGTILYVYFHILLLKVWTAISRAPQEVDGMPISEKIFPWLVIDMVLSAQWDKLVSGGEIYISKTQPMQRLSNVTVVLLVWLSGPIVLIGFWWRSMPAHEEWLTLTILITVAFTVYAGLSSAKSLRQTRNAFPWMDSRVWTAVRRIFIVTLFAVLAMFSWLRTEGGTDQYLSGKLNDTLTFSRADVAVFLDDPTFYRMTPKGHEFIAERFSQQGVFRKFLATKIPAIGQYFDLAPLNLRGVEFSSRPSDWTSHSEALEKSRSEWCSDAQLAPSICSNLDFPSTLDYHNIALLGDWCAENGYTDTQLCAAYLAEQYHAFLENWIRQRRTYLKLNIVPFRLENKDLRRANLENAFLPLSEVKGTRFDEANLSNAVLESSDITGSSFFLSQMAAVDLSNSRTDGLFATYADLEYARLFGASLWKSNFVGVLGAYANFSLAQLNMSEFDVSNLHGSAFDKSSLSGVSFRNVRLSDAKFRGAVMNGTLFYGAGMDDSRFEEALISGADFRDTTGFHRTLLWGAIRKHPTLSGWENARNKADKPIDLNTCWSAGSLSAELAIAYSYQSLIFQSRETEDYDRVRRNLICD